MNNKSFSISIIPISFIAVLLIYLGYINPSNPLTADEYLAQDQDIEGTVISVWEDEEKNYQNVIQLAIRIPYRNGYRLGDVLGEITENTNITFESGIQFDVLDETVDYLFPDLEFTANFHYIENTVENTQYEYEIAEVIFYDKSGLEKTAQEMPATDETGLKIVSFYDQYMNTHEFLNSFVKLYPNTIQELEFYDARLTDIDHSLKRYGIRSAPAIAVFDNEGLVYYSNNSEEFQQEFQRLFEEKYEN